MVDDGVGDEVSLCNLPYETLVYLASWLGAHDLLFRVPVVSKLFHAVVNDPNTWASVVVDSISPTVRMKAFEKVRTFC